MTSEIIKNGKAVLGIEFGSTRIKSVLIDEEFKIIASGEYVWENSFENGFWTYSRDKIIEGLQKSYNNLFNFVKSNYRIEINNLKTIGISGMMHGYIALDKNDNLLVPFRTWRNVTAEKAAEELTKLFKFNIPARWTVAHLYQAILDGEEHVKDIAYLTTLSGYIQYLLTGWKTVGIGEASGIFPIDSKEKDYNRNFLSILQNIISEKYDWKIKDILPSVSCAGQCGGVLTEQGAALLDITGNLQSGIRLCPPEGDAGTGMVATNSIAPYTCNVSAGTSVFSMTVLDKPLATVHREIDIVTTPDGNDVAMIHCNSCTSDLNAWINMFSQFAELSGSNISKQNLYELVFNSAKNGKGDCGGNVTYNFYSGEPVLGLTIGHPMLIRNPESAFNFTDLCKSVLYSTIASLKIGMNILADEGVKLNKICAHGGLFKTGDYGQKILSSALNCPVSVMETAGEGGAWGIAILAAFMENKSQTYLQNFLNEQVFCKAKVTTEIPDESESINIENYIKNYTTKLVAQFSFTNQNENKADSNKSRYAKLKERVYKANMQLVEKGLVILTWGNASEIDRNLGVVAIKPSGVDYDKLTADDIVVVDMEGNPVEGNLRPSSDLKTHLELYKKFPDIGGVVHTHSTYATACAQTGKGIPCYGTTHADYFYGEIPCTRALSKEEIENDYELNTGKVIVEYFSSSNIDYNACPAVLVKNHAPFSWGKEAMKAVENSYVLEQVAKMAILSKQYDAEIQQADKYLSDKHYFRKHGKNAYYGQRK